MRIRSVLVVAKKTALQRYTRERPDPHFLRMLAENHPSVERTRRAHEATQRAVETVASTLAERRLRFKTVYSATKRSAAPHQLVISVGGDGTLLDASHGVVKQRVLAVNSFPETSVGWFCGATAEDFAERLDAILSGAVDPVPLNRVQVEIDGRRLPYPALNDILLAHTNPAATTRYEIHVDGDREEHVSSGVWVSTAAGSTGGIQAAGGVRQPIRSMDLQYAVRELYRRRGSDLTLTGGIISDKIEFTSRLYEGAVFMDGHRLRYRVGFGDQIVARSDDRPLHIYLFDRRPSARDNTT